MDKLSLELLSTTEQMANTASVDIQLWDRHSNACIQAAKRLSDVESGKEVAHERDFLAMSARKYAAFYPQSSEGWISFIEFAEMIEARKNGR